MEKSSVTIMPQEPVIDLKEYALLIAKYKWRMLIFAVIVTAIVAALVSKIKPSYSATASMLISSHTENAVSIEDVYSLDTKRKEYFLTQYEIIKSARVAELVIDKLHLMEHPDFVATKKESAFKKIKNSVKAHFESYFPKEKIEEKKTKEAFLLSDDEKLRQKKISVINKFRQRLIISPVPKTLLVKITFSSHDPRLAALVANTVGETYIELQLDQKLSVTRKAAGWLKSRLDQLRVKLDLSEGKLQDFRLRESLIDVEGVKSFASEELSTLSRSYLDSKKRRMQAESIYLQVENVDEHELGSLTDLPVINNHPALSDIKRAEISAVKKVSELSQRYGPKHPKMISAYAEEALIRKKLDNQIRKMISGIGKELKAAKVSENRLLEQLNQAKSEFQHVTSKESDYLKLKREVQANQNLYDMFLSRFKETDIAIDFETRQASIMDRAEPPHSPNKPRKKLIILAALLASLGLSIVFIIIFDALNDKFRNSSEVESILGLRLIGLTPALVKEKNKTLSVHAFFDEQYKSFAESIRTLRTGIVLSHLDKENMVLAVTSSLPGEGKTTAAINMAFSMAQVEKTLLIEADMRKPSFTRLFPDLPPYQEGLSNVIAGTSSLEECIVRDEKSGLDLLTAGQIPPNPLELLSSNKFASLLLDLKSKYKHIIIDTAPTNLVSDPLVVSRLADSVVYVVKHNGTRHKVAKQGVGRLLEVEAKIAGVILNNVDMNKTSEYRYQSYEGYGEFIKT